ncbi:MAG: glycosyltransferase family 4 protein [Candidatus Cloacimonetes bacterium]|nr:glycosyltransferase family 4 protein [Candidatus Cloacimonadota bacterium]
MRILMILENTFPTDVRVEKEIRSLINAGHEIVLACSSPASNDEVKDWNNATIIRKRMPRFIYKSSVGCLRFPFYFNYWREFLKFVFKQYKFDAIHLHDLPLSKVAKKFSTKYQIPFVLDLHENRPEIMKLYDHVRTFPGNVIISIKRWHKYQKRYTKLADKLILITNEAKNYYMNNYNVDPKKITVMSNFVDLEKINLIPFDNNILNKYKEKFVVVYFGDTGLRRGTATIIQAANLLKGHNDIHFLIIGKSREDRNLKRMIDKLDILNIELIGWVPFNKAVSYIKASKIGLCPFLRNTHHDTTYANKMFQYMAYGRPIIVSDCTSQKNLIEKEECGSVFEAENADDLAKKIIAMKQSPKYKEMSDNSYNAVINKYNWKNAAEQLITLYQEL